MDIRVNELYAVRENTFSWSYPQTHNINDGLTSTVFITLMHSGGYGPPSNSTASPNLLE